MNVWELGILNCIRSLGGVGKLKQVYEHIDKFVDLKGNHLRETIYGGRPAYQHQVRSHITNLCQMGELKRQSTGTYAITPKGIDRIDNTRP